MPMPRDYTMILSDLVENEVLDMREVLESLLNWLSEEEVYSFCQEEYALPVNVAYREKYDREEEGEED
tara:strand:- start:1732 stop:1935 length:204 start_codon:yes stop_codon:yes gene_type:complete